MAPRTSFTFVLTPEQQATLEKLLREGNYRPCQVPYTIVAVEAVGWNCRVNLYTSGKCLVQGAGAEEFVVNILEPQVLHRIVVGYEDILAPEMLAPHMGVDESGKGDFFGPLVVAAAYTNEELAKALQEMGVRDSKMIKSDAKAKSLAVKISELLGPNRFTVVRIGNAAYNKLYMKMRSVNRVLAWAHARCIENLLTTIPSCPRAISDQFGSKESVERALMKQGRSIVLEQRHRAESDIAVAAASILSRAEFLRGLDFLAKRHGQPFPKGASPQVREAAVNLVKNEGPAILVETAKCHFRTTDLVLAEVGRARRDLPPEGQVKSQATSDRNFRKSASPPSASESSQESNGQSGKAAKT